MVQEKVLVLNSGGFDSVVMAHELRVIYPENEVICVFFDYRQPNCALERRYSKKCADEIGAEFMEVTLPCFSWTNGDFFKGTSDTQKQYVEYRNLIFLSYAVSIAEALGCSKIFMATHYVEAGFTDCGIDFIDNFNALITPSGIEVVTPFAWVYKDAISDVAVNLGISTDDFFSCNNPKTDTITGEIKPCGECADCKALEELGFAR